MIARKKSKMGRPKVEHPMEVLNFCLEPHMFKELKKQSKKQGIPRSKFIRNVVNKFLDNNR